MSYEYREPDVVETHTREVVVDSSAGTSSGAILGIVLACLLVLGLIGYFAWWSPSTASTTNVRVETPADSGRAQDIKVEAPDINVTTPPPIINNPPATNQTGGGSGENSGEAQTTTGQ